MKALIPLLVNAESTYVSMCTTQLTPHDCSDEGSSDDERSQYGDSTDSDGDSFS